MVIMASRFTLRHGTGTPVTGDLLDKEFGVSTTDDKLYFRRGSNVRAVQYEIKNNTTTSDPGVTNDIDEGYVFGSHWYNSSSGKVFFCADNTDGAAVWVQLN